MSNYYNANDFYFRFDVGKATNEQLILYMAFISFTRQGVHKEDTAAKLVIDEIIKRLKT